MAFALFYSRHLRTRLERSLHGRDDDGRRGGTGHTSQLAGAHRRRRRRRRQGMPAMSPYNTSYLLGNDTVGGWGERYFFTFYSEFGNGSTVSAVEVTALTIIFTTSVAANAAIAWAVLRYPEMRTVTNCFLLNLTVADLLFVVTAPVLAYVRVAPNWPYGDLACRVLPYSQVILPTLLVVQRPEETRRTAIGLLQWPL